MLSREKSLYADSSTFISVSHLVYSDLIIQKFQTYLRNRRASLEHILAWISHAQLTTAYGCGACRKVTFSYISPKDVFY